MLKFKPMSMWTLITLAASGPISSCGGPWANMIDSTYKGLTANELSRLGGESAAFEPFNVALLADPQVIPGFLRLASKAIDYRDDISLTLILGDLTDRSLRHEFFWVGDVVKHARHPLLTVVGNHDGLIYGENIYNDMFGAINYSFVYRGIKFIMWNNNPYEWGFPDFGWLESEVNSHADVIIAAHQPPGKIERYPEANDQFEAVLSHPNVLGSVHGHTHQYNEQIVGGKPVFTVAQVIDTKYAILRIDEGKKLTLQRCRERNCE